MKLKKLSLLVAGFAIAGLVHSTPAHADEYCSRLEVSVRPLPGYFHGSQPVEVTTRVSPASGVDRRLYDSVVIEIDLELDGAKSIGEPARFTHHAKWGTSSKSNTIYAGEPTVAARVVYASCSTVLPL